MADPSAPPACFSCQSHNYSCPSCNRPPRPGYPTTEMIPPHMRPYPPHHHNPPHHPHPPYHPPPHHPPPHNPPQSYPPPHNSSQSYPTPTYPSYLPTPGFQLPPSRPHVPSPRPAPRQPVRPSYNNSPAYYWVDTMARGGVPTTAIRGGTDIDGNEIYVGRAFHEGDWLPAKIVPGRGQAYVAYNGLEHECEKFQVLCEQRFDWVPANGGHIPPGAVEGGKTVDGESLYIGRAPHEGSLTIGKVHPSHGTCYIPFGGREIGYSDYEVLVLRG